MDLEIFIAIGGLHCRHGGLLNKRKFAHIVCIKMAVNSPRRKILLFHTTNMVAMTSHAINLYHNDITLVCSYNRRLYYRLGTHFCLFEILENYYFKFSLLGHDAQFLHMRFATNSYSPIQTSLKNIQIRRTAISSYLGKILRPN